MSIRESLQKGIGRTIFSKVAPGVFSTLAIICSSILYCSGKPWCSLYEHLDILFKCSCALSAALAIMSYNLRSKAIEFFHKSITLEIIGAHTLKTTLSNAEATISRITNITLLAFASSAFLGLSSALSDSISFFAHIVISITVGLFFACISEYVYVLFCIEEIEISLLVLLAQERASKGKIDLINKLDAEASKAVPPVAKAWRHKD